MDCLVRSVRLPACRLPPRCLVVGRQNRTEEQRHFNLLGVCLSVSLSVCPLVLPPTFKPGTSVKLD